MASPEAQRHDLYHGQRTPRRGASRTAHDLPPRHSDRHLATKDDISQLSLTVTELGRKVDRILFALIVGLVAVVATLISQLPG